MSGSLIKTSNVQACVYKNEKKLTITPNVLFGKKHPIPKL